MTSTGSPSPTPEIRPDGAESGDSKDPYFVEALAQGMAVLRVFEAHPQGLSLAQVARALGCSRTRPFRYLYTLERLGYLRRDLDIGTYRPTALTLALGYAFLDGQPLTELAQPVLERLKDEVLGSAHLGILDRGELVYIGAARTAVITAVNVRIGTRLPATSTSIGRILLAWLEPPEVDRLIGTGPIPALTHRTIVDPQAFRRMLAQARAQGHAYTDEEFHLGVRSVAAPVHDASGRVVAGINATAITHVFTDEHVRDVVIPAVCGAAAELSRGLGHRSR
jgi:IclR family pca regulon transcriptional regulator